MLCWINLAGSCQNIYQGGGLETKKPKKLAKKKCKIKLYMYFFTIKQVEILCILNKVYRTEPKEQAGVSRGLLQAIAQLKEDEMASRSLIVALEGTAMGESVSFEDQFKLPDLVSTEGGEQML